MTARAARPRVALLTPYWSFFEPNVPLDLRADRLAVADRVATLLRADADVVVEALVDSREAGAGAARAVRDAGADAVVVAQTMAVPPAFTMAALDALDAPLVVLVLARRTELGADFDHADITTEGATVGGAQLLNVLHRQGRRHALVTGALTDAATQARMATAVRAATTAGRVRRARLLRVGDPIDGYDCVDADDGALQRAIGMEVVRIPPERIAAAYAAADPAAVVAVERETRARWRLAPGVEADECLARSVRFAAALAAVDDELGVDVGAMNCHVPAIRFADEPGITPCFALGTETSRGIPWTCSGDVVTAVAMLVARLLGGAAIYHEIEALDERTGEAVLANTGEHDLAWCAPHDVPELRRNVWFDEADPRCGACASFGPAPGPASLVAFTPHAEEPSGFRFIVAEGEYTARRFPRTGTVNAGFRFAGAAQGMAAWARWAAAGPNHHSATTQGHLGESVAAVARHLGVGMALVST